MFQLKSRGDSSSLENGVDAMEEERSECIRVHEAPFDPKVDKITSRAAFVWLDMCETFCLVVTGTSGTVCFLCSVFVALIINCYFLF